MAETGCALVCAGGGAPGKINARGSAVSVIYRRTTVRIDRHGNRQRPPADLLRLRNLVVDDSSPMTRRRWSWVWKPRSLRQDAAWRRRARANIGMQHARGKYSPRRLGRLLYPYALEPRRACSKSFCRVHGCAEMLIRRSWVRRALSPEKLPQASSDPSITWDAVSSRACRCLTRVRFSRYVA